MCICDRSEMVWPEPIEYPTEAQMNRAFNLAHSDFTPEQWAAINEHLEVLVFPPTRSGHGEAE